MYKSILLVLPNDVKAQMNFTMAMVFELIVELVLSKSEGKLLVRPARCTEYWLAERIGRSREWVSKSIRRLELLGLIQVERTRQKDGKWDINIYTIGRRLLSILGIACQKFKEYRENMRQKVQSIVHNITFRTKGTMMSIADIFRTGPPDDKKQSSPVTPRDITKAPKSDSQGMPPELIAIIERMTAKIEAAESEGRI